MTLMRLFSSVLFTSRSEPTRITVSVADDGTTLIHALHNEPITVRKGAPVSIEISGSTPEPADALIKVEIFLGREG